MRRIKLRFANLEVEFTDRELGLRRFEEWAGRGTYPVQVIFGPEGCGKSALLRQAVELLRDYGYSVALVSPLNSKPEDKLVLTNELRELARDALSTILGEPVAKLIDTAVDLLYRAVKASIKSRIALLLDDVFQAIGLDKASLLVKSLLNMIEYPSIRYERIVIVVTTSEGITRDEIGRHRWGELTPMWNLPREGLRRLYEQLPGDKPPFENVWRWTGGNPEMLARLYEAGWDADEVVRRLIAEKKLTPNFVDKWRRWLECTVEDPDCLWRPDSPEELINELISRNLIVYNMYDRDARMWIDTPPPQRDTELGIGEGVAWQTPLHREAVRRALTRLRA